MNTIRTFVFIIIDIFLFTDAYTATFYISTNGNDLNSGSSDKPWANFVFAFSNMSGGDTLIIKDGTYPQTIRDIPQGSSTHFTTIKAEHNFKVTITGEGSNVLYVNSNYIRIEGLKFNAGQNQRNVCTIAGSYVKMMKCAFYGAYCDDNTVVATTLTGCDYILFEDCWAFGCGRYKFVTYQSDHVIFRRCVSRFDYHHFDPNGYNDNQCAPFTTYDSYHTLYQNCITIDSGNDWELYGNVVGGLWYANADNAPTYYVKVQGSIFLNLEGFGAINDPTVLDDHIFENVVIWDCKGGAAFENYTGGGNPSYLVDHVTVGNVWGENQDMSKAWGAGFYALDNFNASVKNSIIYKCRDYGLAGHLTSDYNCLSQNGQDYLAPAAAGDHDKNIDPQMKYICRIEEGSALKGAASDGKDIGATITKRYGVSGTLWGEAGYDALTNENLWPFPNENEIKADMSSWTGPNNGKRGFCADGNGLYGGPITLTSYIWEYLGYPCPDEILNSIEENPLNSASGLITYPNPFITEVTLSFYAETPDYYSLKILDIMGKEIAVLYNNKLIMGKYTVDWDGTNYKGEQVCSGVYLTQIISASGFIETGKILLQK